MNPRYILEVESKGPRGREAEVRENLDSWLEQWSRHIAILLVFQCMRL